MSFPQNKLPAVPRLKYEEVHNHIQSGDLLMCSGKSLFSRLIQRATDSIWSHVGFILREENIDCLLVMESVESKGVQMVALSHYINNYNGRGKPYEGDILIARHSGFNESNIRKISYHAVNLLGNRYDKKEILRITSRIIMSKFSKGNECRILVRNNEYICSEYVYECYKSIGIDIPHNCGGFISPADFALTPDIEPICLISS